LKGVLGHEQRLAIFMSIGVVLLFLEKLKIGKQYPIYYYFAFISTLVATQARAFIVFTIIVVGLIYIIEGKKHTKLIFLFLVMLVTASLAGSIDLITDKFSRGDADLTLTGRVPIWEHTLYRAEERPSLGFGFASYMKEGVNTQMFRDYVPPHAHNTIVHSLFEVGAIGTFILLFWMYKLSTLKTIKGKSYGFYLIVLAFLCGLMGMIFGTKINGCLLMVLFLILIEYDLKDKTYRRIS
jgi:exopolysaccharide production protein ExoQ